MVPGDSLIKNRNGEELCLASGAAGPRCDGALPRRSSVVEPFPPSAETLPLAFLNNVLRALPVPGIEVGAGMGSGTAIFCEYLANTVRPEGAVLARLTLPGKADLQPLAWFRLVIARVVSSF